MSTNADVEGAQRDSQGLRGVDDVIDRHGDSSASVDDSGAEGDTSRGRDERNARHYRQRAQAAESERDEARTERDALQAQVTELQRAAIEGALADNRYGLQAKAFWMSGVEVADLVDADTGLVDVEKVNAAVSEAVDMFGLGPRVPRPNPYAGTEGNGPAVSADDQLADVFRVQ